MSRFRSISYAPRSNEDFHSAAETSGAPQPEWTLCRKFKELPVQDNRILQRWTAQGRVLPDDYLVHHELDVCVQARDVAELDAIFRKTTARRLGRISFGLGFTAATLLWLAPLLGGAMLATAILMAALSGWTISRRQSYRLYTAGEHSGTGRPSGSDRVTVPWPA